MALWGKKPQISDKVQVSGIKFYDTQMNEITETEESSFKAKLIKNDYEDKVLKTEFYVVATPDDAYEPYLEWKVISGENDAVLVNLSKEDDPNLGMPPEVDKDENWTYHNRYHFNVQFTNKEIFEIEFSATKAKPVKRERIKFVWTGIKHSDIIIIDD